METLQPIFDFFAGEGGWPLVRAVLLIAVGWLAARLLTTALVRLLGGVLDTQRMFLIRRTVFYGIILLAVFSAMLELGFNLGVLLGAAGILTVALGFASQTSASNVISGLFLIGEGPFAIGDIIRVGDLTGEVLSIDLLSVKLRTLDNLYVRVPNESLIKSNVTTLTRFPIRRYDMLLNVAYKEDLNRVRELLETVAADNAVCLDEPQPLFIFQAFGESGLNIQFSVWATRENFLKLRNTMPADVKQAFDAGGVEIPFPQRGLHLHDRGQPVAVRLVDSASEPEPRTNSND